MKPDEKSRKIILKAYWGSKGWKSRPEISEKDLAHLRHTGYLFRGNPAGHDEAVTRLVRARENVPKASVVDAFVSSLITRELEYRSPLGSYAHALHLHEHTFEPAAHLCSRLCATCGLPERVTADWSVLNFERIKWGGVRHDEVTFQAFDLEQLAEQEPREPIAEAWHVLGSILEVAAAKPQSVSGLKQALAAMLPSNDSERDVLCHILAYAGVLAPADCPAFYLTYVPFSRRGDGAPRTDQKYPLSWWRGGINREAVLFWFGELQPNS